MFFSVKVGPVSFLKVSNPTESESAVQLYAQKAFISISHAFIVRKDKGGKVEDRLGILKSDAEVENA